MASAREKSVLVLGASGGIGQLFVRMATESGYNVRALSRQPLTDAPPTVDVTLGSALDADTVRRAVDGVDQVLITLGIRRTTKSIWAPLVSPPDLVTQAMSHVIAAVRGSQVRVITVSAHGARASMSQIPWVGRTILKVSKLRPTFEDHSTQEALLEQSGLRGLIVRPPVLTDDPDDFYQEVKDPTVMGLWSKMSRRAVATFLVRELGDARTGIVTITGRR